MTNETMPTQDETPPEPETVRVSFDVQERDEEPLDLGAKSHVGIGLPVSGPLGSSIEPQDPKHDDFDVWITNIDGVDWAEGGFRAILARDSPEYAIDPQTGLRVSVKGRITEYSQPITTEEIARDHGGGRYAVVVVGPDPAGIKPQHQFGKKVFQIAGNPRPIPAIAGGAPAVATGHSMSDRLASEALKYTVDGAKDAKAEARAEREARTKEAYEVEERTLKHADRLIDLARDAGSAREDAARERADAERQRADRLERQKDALEVRLANLEHAIREGNNGKNEGSILDGAAKMIGALKEDRPALDPVTLREERSRWDEERRELKRMHEDVMRDMKQQHQRELEDMRDRNRDQLETERTHHRTQLDTEIATRKRDYDTSRDDLRRREDEMRTRYEAELRSIENRFRDQIQSNQSRHEDELKRERDRAEHATKIEVAAKQARIDSLEHEIHRIRGERDDLKVEIRQRETELLTLRNDVAQKAAELKHRPSSGDALGQALEYKDRLDKLLGRDDEKKGSTFTDIVESPTVSGFLTKALEVVSGETKAKREKELEIAKIHSETKKHEAAAKLADVHTQMQQQAAPNPLPSQTKLPAAPSPNPNPQPGPMMGSSPRPGGASSPPQPAPVAQPAAYRSQVPSDLPEPPVERELANGGEFKPLEGVLLSAEMCIRGGVGPDEFLDELLKGAVDSPVPITIELFHERLVNEMLPTEFLEDLDKEGGREAFPVLYHPYGRRWVRGLWDAISERYSAEHGPGEREDEDEDEDDLNDLGL